MVEQLLHLKTRQKVKHYLFCIYEFIAIICFANVDDGKCNLFDGSTISSTFSTTYPHSHGSLGLYENNPTTVGCAYDAGKGKVETLTSSGWLSLNDHPQYDYILLALISF